MKEGFNIIIQLVWVVLALAIGVSISMCLSLRSIFGGIFSLIVYFLMTIISNWIKAMKDPNVQIASQLRMSVKRYRHYQRLFDEYQTFMLKHGINSRASEEKFKEIFKQIDNPNEWRRYQQYREHSASITRMYYQQRANE